MTIHLKNGTLIDPLGLQESKSDVYIEGNLVVGVGRKPSGFKASQTIDASGHWIMPGLVDSQARLREPGHTHKANIASETDAAVRNGITSLCIPPDTLPVIDNSAVVDLIHHQNAKAGNQCHIYTIGALSRELEGGELCNMASLKASGCIAFSNAGRPFVNNLVQRRAMDYAAGQKMLVIIQPRDNELYAHGCAHESAVSTRLGLPAIPEAWLRTRKRRFHAPRPASDSGSRRNRSTGKRHRTGRPNRGPHPFWPVILCPVSRHDQAGKSSWITDNGRLCHASAFSHRSRHR